MSAAPPGVDGAMMRTGRVGQSAALQRPRRRKRRRARRDQRNNRAFHMALMTHASDAMMRALRAPRKHRCANNGIDRGRARTAASPPESGEMTMRRARACLLSLAIAFVGMLALAGALASEASGRAATLLQCARRTLAGTGLAGARRSGAQPGLSVAGDQDHRAARARRARRHARAHRVATAGRGVGPGGRGREPPRRRRRGRRRSGRASAGRRLHAVHGEPRDQRGDRASHPGSPSIPPATSFRSPTSRRFPTCWWSIPACR